jgi:hypothetical protein
MKEIYNSNTDSIDSYITTDSINNEIIENNSNVTVELDNDIENYKITNILYNLNIINNLQYNQKLWLENNTLKIDKNIYFSSIKRFINNQNRNSILDFIYNIIIEISKHKYYDKNNSIKKLLKKIIIKLSDMKILYKNKREKINEIINLILNIEYD